MDKATKLARVREIRANALRLLKERGEWEDVSGTKHLGLKIGSLSISYRTPFQPVPKPPEAMMYFAALLGRKIDHPYGLDIWHGKKVLNLVWDESESLEIVSYKPGEWEEILVAD